MLTLEHVVDPSDSLTEQTSTPGLAQRRLDAGLGECAAFRRGRGNREDRHCVEPRKLCAKGFEGPGVVILQRRAQRVHLALALPDRVLVVAGEQLDCVAQDTVTGNRTVIVPVRSHEVRQHLGVAGI